VSTEVLWKPNVLCPQMCPWSTQETPILGFRGRKTQLTPCSTLSYGHHWTSKGLTERFSSGLRQKARLWHSQITSIKRLKPKATSYLVSDGQGLGLEILPSGSRSWRYRYRFNGKLEKVSLGHYPAFNLQAARKKRDEYAEMLAHGKVAGAA
jgi:hypothetical protein